MRRFRPSLIAGALLVAGALATDRPIAARQLATAPELKAAFLINFARFTTWPQEALGTGAGLSMCVSGDPRLADTIEELGQRERIQDREILVRRVKGDVSGCHLLYWAAATLSREQDLLLVVVKRPVLTVSDDANFVKLGGIANFFVDDGRMRFSVNPAAAERASLRISSKLLNLARIVKDG
jgi:hypothetical protein